MTQQIQRREDTAIWRVVDTDQSTPQQQIIYVTVDGPHWLQLLLNVPPHTLIALATVAGVTGGVVIVAALVLAAIVAQLAATVAVAVVAAFVAIVALTTLTRL